MDSPAAIASRSSLLDYVQATQQRIAATVDATRAGQLDVQRRIRALVVTSTENMPQPPAASAHARALALQRQRRRSRSQRQPRSSPSTLTTTTAADDDGDYVDHHDARSTTTEFSVPPPRSDDFSSRSLLPKSLSLWHDCDAEIARVWHAADEWLNLDLGTPHPALDNPTLRNEADLKDWFLIHITPHLATMLDAIPRHAQRSPPSATEVETPLIEAFRRTHHFYHASERATPIPFAVNTDAVVLFHELRDNRELRELLQPHPQSLLDLFRAGHIKPRTDFEFLRTTTAGVRDQTCLVIEFKNPHELTPELVGQVLFHFDRCVRNPALLHHLATTPGNDAAIPVRSAMLLDPRAVTAPAKVVLRALIQVYHAAVVRRQRYAMLTSGVASLLVAIDWSHPTEPGQHVKVRLCIGDPWIAQPQWHGPHRPSLAYWCLGLLFLQLEAGRVDDDDIDRLVHQLQAQIRSSHAEPKDETSNGEGEGEGEGGRRTSKRLCAPPPPRSGEGTRGPNDVCLDAALELMHGEEPKHALRRFVAEVEPGMDKVRVVEGAGFAALIADLAELDLETDEGLDQPTWSLLHDRPWIYGPVPEEHNRRLALTDDAPLATDILAAAKWQEEDEAGMVQPARTGARMGRRSDTSDTTVQSDGSAGTRATTSDASTPWPSPISSTSTLQTPPPSPSSVKAAAAPRWLHDEEPVRVEPKRRGLTLAKLRLAARRVLHAKRSYRSLPALELPSTTQVEKEQEGCAHAGAAR